MKMTSPALSKAELVDKLTTRATRLFTKANWTLLVELARANVKINDHNSILGVFWSLLGPAAMLLVLYHIFRTRFGQGVEAYPLYLLIGIVLVSFFMTATRYMTNVFLANRIIFLNSTVPREILIGSKLFIHLYKFLIELILCGVFSLFYGVFAWQDILLLGPLVIAYVGFVLGVSLVIALVYCFATDIEHIWFLASHLLFFVTPVFYTLDSLSALAGKIIYWGNPLTPFLLSFREILMGAGSVNMPTYVHSVIVGCVFLALGYSAFLLLENTVVERA